MVFRSYPRATKLHAVRMAIEGLSFAEIRRLLGESLSRQSFCRWIALYKETQCVIRDPEDYKTRGRPALLSREECDFMVRLVESEPGLFLSEIRERLYDSSGTLLSEAGVHRDLVERLSITLKKPKTKNCRKDLVAKLAFEESMEFFPADFLVFTDESAFCDKDLLRSMARSKRGTPSSRVVINQNPEHWSILPAISIDGLITLTATTDTFNGREFEHFLENDLLPQMNRYPDFNLVLVCDNAAIHRGDQVCELCNQAGVWLMYLPPYCPELNPIELCFAAVKQQLRASQILTCTNDPEWEIRRLAGEIMTADLCYSLYKHCGYCVPEN